MIFEGVVITSKPDGAAHITPMGFRRTDDTVLISPFLPSTTLENLRRDGRAVMNLTDDVRVTAGCLTGRRDWPLVRASSIDGWRLRDSLAHLELEVTSCDEDVERPRFTCRIVSEASHAHFSGFNRAQAAVLEAAILYSRLDWLAPDKLKREMRYLKVAIDKTAGPRERTAWDWLVTAMTAHPRHRLNLEMDP